MILISIGKLLRCNSLSSTQTDVLISGLDKINLFNPKGFCAAYAAATVPPQELPNKLNFSIESSAQIQLISSKNLGRFQLSGSSGLSDLPASS